jgi:hypothetical protein
MQHRKPSSAVDPTKPPPGSSRFKSEWYDFSEAAQRLFGHAIAYTTTVDERDKFSHHPSGASISVPMDGTILLDLLWHQAMAGRE